MIDLHVHSTASDGTVTPKELASRGKKFSVFALTDHDNTDGAAAFLEASRAEALPSDALRLAGIELSVDPGAGYGKFHLLGLGIDPENTELKAFLDEIRAGRDARNLQILAKLNHLGVAITLDDVRKYANGKITARPHFARVLVERGFARDLKDAFIRYVGDDAPAYVTRYHPDPARAIEIIHRAGGAAVMAHPKYWTANAAQLRTGLAALRLKGLDGLEAIYQANRPEETIDHLRAAAELGLIVTAGSDFHGANKPTIPLGMRVSDEAAFTRPLRSVLANYGCKFVQ